MRKPLLVAGSQVVAIVFIARCVLRVLVAMSGGNADLIYGMWLAPFWIDAVLAAVCVFCLIHVKRRDPLGLVCAVVPAFIWFALVAFSPESWTALHWLPDGGPREPWGIPQGYTYDVRYDSHEGLIGACVSVLAIEVVLLALIVSLFVSKRVRQFYDFDLRRLRSLRTNSAP